MNTQQLTRACRAAALLISAGILAMCAKGPPAAQTSQSKGSYELRECPHDWDTSVAAPALAGPITNIPEFHDCQRFIVGQGPAYDSIYAIFAAADSRARWERLRAMAHSRMKGREPPRTPAPGTPGLVVAEIWSNGGSYPQLGIGPGFNCLFAYYQGSALHAAMLTVGGNKDPQCATWTALPPAPAGTPLDIVMKAAPGYVLADYPAVARWEWDPKDALQYIGIACGAAWCNVGPLAANGGFHAVAPLSVGPGKRVTAIKGWYDEQRIALPPPPGSAPGILPNPGTVLAHAVPDPKLDTRILTDFQAGRWVPAATLTFSETPAAFLAKFGIAPAAGTGPISVSLCDASKKSCPGVPATAPTCTTTTPTWWAKVEWRGGTPVYRCVQQWTAPPGPHVVGTVRWRWLDRDETLWMRCADGCCTLT